MQPRGAPAQQAGPEHGGRMSVTVTVAVEVGLGVEGGRLVAQLLLPADSRHQTEGGAQAASAARGTALRPRPSPPLARAPRCARGARMGPPDRARAPVRSGGEAVARLA